MFKNLVKENSRIKEYFCFILVPTEIAIFELHIFPHKLNHWNGQFDSQRVKLSNTRYEFIFSKNHGKNIL